MADYTKPAQINLVEKNPTALWLWGPEVIPLPGVGTRSADLFPLLARKRFTGCGGGAPAGAFNVSMRPLVLGWVDK
jgi:hypothetical protein